MKKPSHPLHNIGALALIALFLSVRTQATEPTFADVFVASQDGYKSIRIPAVVVTKAGVVLAFAEGRAANTDRHHSQAQS
jgi:hypothetical protein